VAGTLKSESGLGFGGGEVVTMIGMRWLIVLVCAVSLWAQKKTIFLITDAEGVGGVCRQEQTEPKDPELRQLLTGEINAAVEGFLAGGADEVLVWDGHDGSQTLSTLTIHPKAKLLMGAMGASMMMERRFSAVAYVGQHSKANIRGGIMAHSYSSLGIQNMLLNGKPVGEIDVIAAMAGHFGTPVIMLSGDQAAASEIREIVPDVEVAIVKEGLGRYNCISLSATAARDAVREAARKSVAKIGTIKPYTVKGPVTLQVEYTTRNSLPLDADLRTGAEVLDDRTIRFKGKDILEAWRLYRSR
jgi:D-amino peptidase